MRKRLLETAVCGGAEVRYYLLAEDLEAGVTAYGFCVERERERAILRGLTPCEAAARELLRAMARGTVTPVTARDVAEDWLLA